MVLDGVVPLIMPRLGPEAEPGVVPLIMLINELMDDMLEVLLTSAKENNASNATAMVAIARYDEDFEYMFIRVYRIISQSWLCKIKIALKPS